MKVSGEGGPLGADRSAGASFGGAAGMRVMAVFHGLFAGAQVLLGAIFVHAADLAPVAAGVWVLRLEGAAMVGGGGLLLGVALGMARLRGWSVRAACYYAMATVVWACGAIVANVALRELGVFEAPRNLYGLLVVLVAHGVALWYDVTRKPGNAKAS